jgi:diguanylate cyclase (GGDEF)-like protein
MHTEIKATVNLGHRIDALRLALQTLDTDPTSEATIRRMAANLRASCDLTGAEQTSIFAQQVETSPRETLASLLKELIAHLRQEFAMQEPVRLSILLVSADHSLRDALTTIFNTSGHLVQTCASIAAARQALRETPPSFLIVDSILSGEDGLQLIPEIRSNPLTAAMPVIAIVPQHADVNADPSLVHEADFYVNKPVNVTTVAEFIVARSKRRFEHGRPSRRDPLSGLQNRAAFIEACEIHQSTAKQDKPLSLALIGIRDFDLINQECTRETIDDLVRRIGSILSSSFRATDFVARWGNAEFAVSFPGEDHFGVTKALEKVLTIINRHKVTKPNGKTIPIHSSAGFAILRSDDSLADIITQVEGYLFQAMFGSSSKTTQIASDSIPATQQTARIALCIGESTMERAVTQIISKDHIHVETLSIAQNPLAELTSSSFHMLIIDDSLPNDGAMQLIKSVRSSPKLSRLHILILASSEDQVTKALELGVSNYTLKPLVPSIFLTAVRRALSRSRQATTSNIYTVMIVDQNIPQLLIAGTVLFQQTGCSVCLAHGFQDALKRYQERRPDCIILDCDIPEVALRDFAKRVSILPDFDKIDIIAASNKSDSFGRALTSTFTIKGRITHPFKPTAFMEQLSSIIALPTNSDHISSDRNPIDAEIQRILSRSP